MKKLTILAALLSIQAAVAAPAIAAPKEVVVNQPGIQLALADFAPTMATWGGRQVVTGYEALLDVKDAAANQPLVIQASTESSGSWFAANFTMTTELACSGVPFGISKAYGKRVNNESTPARAEIREMRTPDQCTQLRVRLVKGGSLSRQFYTRIESINVNIRLVAGSQS